MKRCSDIGDRLPAGAVVEVEVLAHVVLVRVLVQEPTVHGLLQAAREGNEVSARARPWMDKIRTNRGCSGTDSSCSTERR